VTFGGHVPINILKGMTYSLAACFFWGLISVVPLYMDGFTPIEITFGRFLFYGVVSCLLFVQIFMQGRGQYPLPMWIKAIGFSLCCILCDYFFVLSLRYSNSALSTLILGISPISIAFYGNWLQKDCSNKTLILPSFLILFGLVVINVPMIMQSSTPSTYILGLFYAIMSLAAWSWFVVKNSSFLKINAQVNSRDWTTLIGMFSLLWVLVVGLAHSIFEEQLDFNKYLIPTQELGIFLVGSLILGVFCSWLGAFLWNKASLNLPVSLLGLMMIFSTVFGLCFVYFYEQRLPPKLEFLGIIFLLSAIIYGIRVAAKTLSSSSINSSG
jgi:drug/metabolite transporter (DMT)-like permease